MGVGTFLLLALVSFALQKSLVQPQPKERVQVRQKYSPFDSRRAYSDLESILAFGPRTPGSEGSRQTRDYLKTELTKAGLHVWEHPFEASTPKGPVKMTNLVAEVEGTRPGIVLFGNHYDTKQLPGINFVGANDAGSTTAWMLEWARALGPKRDGKTLWLVWFDGEEAYGDWTETDSLYGSRALVERLKVQGELQQVRAMINVDMIGDCYLNIMRDEGAPEWMWRTIWDTAQRLGYKEHFANLNRDIQDDHIPFRRAGIPALLLIDFIYGGSVAEHQKNWHTAQDKLERVCPESLQAVADVLYHALPAIEGRLETPGTPPL